MLDLTTTFNNDLYELKLLDGTLLKLKRPTQQMTETLMRLQGVDNSVAVGSIMGIFVRVLNRNNAGIEYTEEDLAEDYDLTVAMYVVQDYFTYWNNEVAAKVNFLQSQQ
jgi:uncharacterized protein YdgA (DUF945 family)